VAFIIFLAIGAAATYQHVLPPFSDLQNQVWTLLTPLAGVLLALKTYLDVIDAKVADGTYAPGDIKALFYTADWWTAMIAVGIGTAQALGLKVMNEDEQVMLVNILLALTNIVLSSFTNRTQTQALTVTAKVAAQPLTPPSSEAAGAG
jgi:hypothetical protein